MREIVTVLNISNNVVNVTCSTKACKGCHNELFCSKKDSSFSVNNPNNLSITEGDMLEIEIPEKKAVFTVLTTLLFPLLFFIPGYFVGKLIRDNEPLIALIGFLFIALGFLLSSLFFKGRKKEYSPYIVRKL